MKIYVASFLEMKICTEINYTERYEYNKSLHFYFISNKI